MDTHSLPQILILGARGLVGQTVFSFLNKNFKTKVIGTTSQEIDSKFIYFDANNASATLESLLLLYPNLNLVINCIGITPQKMKSEQEYKIINTDFPHLLANMCQKLKINCIHISSDAVFDALSGVCTEDDTPSATDSYGKSKSLGEPQSPTTLTIRTSFLGPDKYKNSGLLSWLAHTTQPTVSGFSKVDWSGCSTLQFAELCLWLSDKNNFAVIRSQTPLLHFAPLVSNKYEILIAWKKIMNVSTEIKKEPKVKATRILKSNLKEKILNSYENDIEKELLRLYV